jgi:hypothetical protein
MKKGLFLAVITVFATELLFAQFPQGHTSYLTDGVAATLPEIPVDEKLTYNISGKAMGPATADSPDPYLLPVENNGYYLEFAAEKGITLPGATAADLLPYGPCSTDNFAAFTNLTQPYRIQVFVNGKPTVNRVTSITAALGQIPAERIKVIDIRTASSDDSDPADEADINIRVTQIK